MAYLYPTPERQPYPVPTPIEHEPQVIDSKTLMDASVQDEMLTQERQRQQAEQQKAASEFTQMARQAALNALQRQMAGNIVAQKMNYRDALANGDVVAMDYANKLADAQRAQGNAIGWDGAGYGSDVPLEQAAQNLANNDARALANIFYNQQNSDDHYTMEIANLLDKGYSIDSAKRMAAQSADRLDRRNNAELIDSFATYGLDPRGVITNNGVRILGSLAQNGNSDLANFYANMYAKPINEYNYQNEVSKAADANNYAMQRQRLAGELQEQQAQNNWNRSEQTAVNNIQRQLDLATGMLGIKQMEQEMQVATRQKYADYLAKMGVITPEMAASYALTGYLVPKGAKGGSTGGADSKLIKAMQDEAAKATEMANEARLNGDEAGYKMWMERASAYQARIDATLGMGGDSENSGYAEIANDYDKFRAFYQKALDDAANDPDVTYADIIAHAERVNKEFADHFFDDSYRNAKRPGAVEKKQEPANTESKSEPATITTIEPVAPSGIGYKDNRSAFARGVDTVKDILAPGWVKVKRNGKEVTISRAALKPDDEIVE